MLGPHSNLGLIEFQAAYGMAKELGAVYVNIHLEERLVIVVVVPRYDVFTNGTFVKEFSHGLNQSCIPFELSAIF